MRKLEFTGTVQANDRELVIPGRDDPFLKPDDWPTQLAPGTVNIEVGTFSNAITEIGEGEGLAKLDAGKLRPALVIPQRKSVGSTLTPDTDHPTRGFAEVWRADLHVVGTGQETTCWAIRIIGSDATRTLRLVAEEDLRSRFNLADGTAVKVTIWEEESKWTPPTPDEIVADWCEAARNIEGGFGVEKAMDYLIGEKFLNFLEVAETNRDWQQAIPAFVAEIKSIFEPWQLAQHLEVARQTEPFDPSVYEDADPEDMKMERTADLRRSAADLMLLEWARELLLEEEG
jgi:hypothetical protein